MTEGSFSIPRLHLDSLEYPLSSITIGCDELRFNLSNGVIRGSNRCHGRIPTLGQNPMSFSLVPFPNAAPDSCLRSPSYDGSSDGPAWRFTFCVGRIRSHEASAFDCESLPPTGTEPSRFGSADCRILLALDQADLPLADRNHIKTFDFVEFPSRLGAAKVSAAIFAEAPKETWTKGSERGFDSGGCRYETAQSALGMSSHCRTNLVGVRHIY
jgi:hypothetical protein